MENKEQEKEIDQVRIVAFTPSGLISSRWSEDDEETVAMGGLMEDISRLSVMQFPDENGHLLYLPEGVIQRTVFRLERKWK